MSFIFSHATVEDEGGPITFGTVYNKDTSAATSGNAITLSGVAMEDGPNRIMIIGYGGENHNQDPTSFAYGGQALTLQEQTTVAGQVMTLYLIKEADLPADTSTSANVVLTPHASGPYGGVFGVVNFTNVDQTTPINTTVTAEETTSNWFDTITPAKDHSFLVEFLSAGFDTVNHTPNQGETETLDKAGPGGTIRFSINTKSDVSAVATNVGGTYAGSQPRLVAYAVAVAPTIAHL